MTLPVNSRMTPPIVLDPTRTVSLLTRELEEHGFALIPNLLTPDQLAGMQRAFEARLRHLRSSDVDGYERTEPYRLMVQDLLTLDQGFVDAALDPRVTRACREYIGEGFALVEAKGWRTLPTRAFHGWHGDMWYDRDKVEGIPRELKLCIYLSDVKSGAFAYVKGTHGKQHPHILPRDEVVQIEASRVVEFLGSAGTAILFDTSGIHRQSVPVLEPRNAIFYGYHDPGVPLQAEDVAYNRYHSLLLNAALLGNLSTEDCRILGFGDKRNFKAGHVRKPRHPGFAIVMGMLQGGLLRWDHFLTRVRGRLRRMMGR